MNHSLARAAFVALLVIPLAAVGSWAAGEAESGGSAADIDTVPVYGGNLNMAQRHGASPLDPTDLQRDTVAYAAFYDLAWVVDYLKGPRGTGEESYPNHWFIDIRKQTSQLIESWEFPDIESAVFRVRKGVRFWRAEDVARPNPALADYYGTELTAQTMVDRWNVDAAVEGAAAADRDWQWSVRADDPWVIDVKFPAPDATNWFVVTVSRISWSHPAMHTAEGVNPNDWQDALGTGPWIPTDHVPGVTTKLKKNPNYWDVDPFIPENAVPYLDTKVMTPTADDPAITIAALRSGQLDVFGFHGLQPEDVAALERTNPELGHVPQGSLLRGYNVNLNIPGSPWADRRVRYAAMLAVNQQEMVDSFYYGLAYPGGYPAQSLHGDNFIGHEKLKAMGRGDLAELYEYHPDKARALLAEAGYPDGFDTTILAMHSVAEDVELFAGYLREVGINAELDLMESAAYYSASLGPNPDPRFTGLTFIDAGAPQIGLMGTMNFHHDPRASLVWYGNPLGEHVTPENRAAAERQMELIDAAKTARDPETYRRRWTELYLHTLEEAWHISGVTVENHVYWQPWVKGFGGAVGDLSSQANISKWWWVDCNAKRSSTGRACAD